MYKKSQVQPLLIVPTRTSIIDASLPSAVSQGYFLKRSALTGIGLSHGRLLTSPLFPSLLPRIQDKTSSIPFRPSPMSSRGGRAASTPWGRLKPLNLDPLEAIGLPSKGDKRFVWAHASMPGVCLLASHLFTDWSRRLLDYKAQERYYTKIVERYMEFCTDAGRGDELSRRLARMDTSQGNARIERPQTAPSASDMSIDASLGQKDLATLMMAMRKLREGIVASHRVDDFSIQAYIFCIRLSILVKHMESYHPAILHLLRKMHPVQALTSMELQEFVGYLVLDLACRQNNLAEAFAVRHQYRLHDPKVDAVLRSLAHDNYFLFWRVKQSVDGHKAKLMEFAQDDMKRQTLKCLGRGYLSIDKPSLEQYTNTSWASLTKDYGVGWQLEGNNVIIRKPKVR